MFEGTDQTVTFSTDELTVLSDILRRLPETGSGLSAITYFTRKSEFAAAAAKIEGAKLASYQIAG